MNHSVNTYPLTKFESSLQLLRKAEDRTLSWLETIVTAALI